MSVNDIRLKIGFQTHWKTKKLLKAHGPQAVLSLIWLWAFAANSKPDGRLTGMSLEEIAIAADWPDNPDEFIKAIKNAKYLDLDKSGTYVIHDWEQHQPWAATAHIRSKQAKKAAQMRWQKRGVNADSMPSACGPHADRYAPSPFPNPIPTPKSSSLRSEDFSPAAKDAAGDPPVFTLPVLGGGEFPVTQAQVSSWSEAYPAVDVSLALRQMREWLESNPTKKRRHVRRFITNWLKREQERGGNRGGLRPSGKKPQPQGVMVPWS